MKFHSLYPLLKFQKQNHLNAILQSNKLLNDRAKVLDPGTFKSKYVVYVLNTPEKEFSVERRYSDFVLLRQEMIKNFPGYFVPPLPIKKIGGNIELPFINERKNELQLFINDVVNHPALKTFELLIQFLSLPNKEWEEKTKAASKVNPPKEISNYLTPEGEAKVLFTNGMREYEKRLQGAAKNIRDSFNELKVAIKVVSDDIGKLSNSINNVSKIYKKINETYVSLGQQQYAELFNRISNGHAKLSEDYIALRNDIDLRFACIFNYHANETNSLEELIAANKLAGEQMESYEKKLEKMKEKKFESKSTETWELDAEALSQSGYILTDKSVAFKEMLPKESQEARNLRIIYGYYINKVFEEHCSMIDRNKDKFKKIFYESAKSFAIKEEKIKNEWIEIMRSVKAMKFTPANCKK